MATHLKHGRLKLFLAIVVIAAAALLYGVWQDTRTFADRELGAAEPGTVLVIEPGDGFNAVLAKLRALGISQGNDLQWKALAKSMGVAGRLHVGEYAMDEALTPRELLDRLGRGQVIQRKFTIVEGWSFRELRAAISADPILEDEIASLSDAQLMRRIGRPGVHPEGRFLPETYVFARGAGELEVLDRAAHAMDEALANEWRDRAEDLPLSSPVQLLTLASIVEKETGVPGERPQIAGVFVRRLKMGMRLQTDPTVIYGMGSAYAGNIRRVDLESDNPYNTYTRTGLPPTPIAMPGRAALNAAANPAPGEAIYFVASGNGGHQFSATLAEHNAAVRKYLLRR